MMFSFAKGVGFFFRGFSLIFRKKIRKFAVLPFALNVVIFSILIGFGASRFAILIDWLLPAEWEWLGWILWPVFALGVMVIVFYTFILVCNFVAAPFNGLLSEAVEHHLTGTPIPDQGGVRGMVMNLIPAVASEGKKNLYFLVRAIPLLVLFIVPGVNIVAPPLWIVFSSWMIGREYLDYPMGNHGLLFTEQRVQLRKNRGMVLGFGGGVLILLMVPLVNLFVIPAAVAGATAMWVEAFEGESH